MQRRFSRKNIVSVLLGLGLVFGCGLRAWAAEPRFRLTPGADALLIELDGRPVARYVFRDPQVSRPYFDRVCTSSGIEVTRRHPPRDGVDPTDHVGLHTGLWLSFGDLNGNDYWRLKARTEHAGFVEAPVAVDGEARFAVRNRYLSSRDAEVVCTEVCRYTVRTCGAGWLLVADSQFRPEGADLVFGDQEELGWGVRVATPLGVDRGAGGRMVDSEGRRNGRQIWGQQVAWCDYAGPLEGRWVGLQVCAGRENFHPSWAHARDYGFVALNPFARQAFTKQESRPKVVPQGQTLALRFGVVVHESETEEQCDLSRGYAEFDATPRRETLFRSGEAGYHTFRIPALAATPRGTLLAFCEGRKSSAGDEGDIDLLLRRSLDGGTDWLPTQVVHEEGGAAKTTIGNPCVVIDRDTGVVWLTLCRNNRDVLLMSSRDEGATWSAPQDITSSVKDPSWGWFATGPGHGIQLSHGRHRGRLVIPCDCGFTPQLKNETQHSLVIYSDDHGATWKRGTPTEAAMDECQVAERDDGTLLLSLRNYRGKNLRAFATSVDGGETWSSPEHHPQVSCPTCQAGLLGVGPASARMFVYCGPAGPGRANLGLRLSRDGGVTWSENRLIQAGPSAYSDLCELPDGGLGIVLETGEAKASERLDYVRVGPAWWNR
jgi:sialidase-1